MTAPRHRLFPLAEIALALVSLALSAALAELLLRRFYPVHGVLYRLHPRYLHEHVPGARRLFVHLPRDGGGRILVTVNSAGLIGPELVEARPRRRVVVYGDSFVAGEFSPRGERFVARLAERLSRGAPAPVEVVNAGVAGYGPDQVALRLEDEMESLRPDLVIVAVFAGNDFGDLIRNRLFRLDAAGQLTQQAPFIGPALRAEFAKAERQAQGSQLLRGLRDLVARDAPLVHEMLPPGGYAYLLTRRKREFRLGRDSLEVAHVLGDPYDVDVSLDPGSESARYKRALMEQVLARIASTAATRNLALFFLFIPSAFDVAEGFPHSDPAEFPAYRPSALTDALVEAAERHGLAFLDLYPAFAAARPKELFFHDDEHWNAEGQSLAAAHAAAVIRARGLFD